MPAINDQFGQFFRNRRNALDLNLSEFCRQNGFDKGNISRLERGLVKPPESSDLLRTYASALQLQSGSEDWKAFMGHAAIARGKLPSAVSDERAADVEEMFRRLGRRLHDSWVKAEHLEQWSSTRAAQAGLPALVRQLIHASTERPTRIEMPGGEGVQRHGWDGIVEAPTRSLFVPDGVSGWEISVEQRPAAKAERDFKARKTGPLGLPPSEVTFVFVTSRKWDRKQKWRDEKRAIGKWRSVEVYDSIDLEAWMEATPGVDAWMAEQLGCRPAGVVAISDYWESLRRSCEPHLKPDVFLTSRDNTATELRDFLLGTSGVMAIECRSPIEALDFAAAYLALDKSDVSDVAMEDEDRLRVQSRTVVVRDRAQWDGLSHANGPLNLLPNPSLSLSGEELNAAVSHGHRILIAATQFSNHQLQPVKLPRPSRYELDKALRKSGFEKQAADDASRAAGGSLSVLKRRLSTVPSPRLPSWCNGPDLEYFLPMLFVGAWDDANEVDRAVLSRLSGRPYSELQSAANRLALVDDAPLTRTETRWRLVSPEDSWSLVGQHVTGDLLELFETIAIEVLSQEDGAISLSTDDRIKASIRGTLNLIASVLLRRGIIETTAILGSGFGPVTDLSGATGIVRTILQNATWLRWATLGSQLPLLAEAAPEAFLAAISTDLKKKRPELAKLLADHSEDHPLMSACHHAGLLWALEGLAWSPEQLSRVCTILASLDEVDRGARSGNRPTCSLREILLTWHPQTAAGVDKRIAVLKSLAAHTPAVAWKLLFAMLPQGQSSSTPTHRPVWRDWVSAWQEGTSNADYWKQVTAAAELIVQLVGSDPARWSEVLDKLPLVPEPYRNQLIEQLQNFPADEIDREARRHLAEHLRKTIRRHRDFSDAGWGLPAEAVDQLEQALSTLLPDGLREQHAWLFVEWLELEGFRGEHEQMENEAARLREKAVAEIVDLDGFDGVLQLLKIVESPGAVGVSLAMSKLVDDEKIFPQLLTDVDPQIRALAASFARRRIRDAGWQWIRELPLKRWKVEDTAALLIEAVFDETTWQFVDNLGEEVRRRYWNTVWAHSSFNLSDVQVETACREFLNAGRCEAAIRVLSGVTWDKASVAPMLAIDALTACSEQNEPDSETQLGDETLGRIQRLFGWLQKTVPFRDDEPTRRLAELEWRFLSLLDGYGALPETLIYCLSYDPKFFAKLIARTFRSNDEQEPEKEWTEEQQQLASQGYRLLMKWNRIPGTQSDDSVDEEQLLQWLERARAMCRDSGHLEFADSRIGEMLANCPKPEDEDTMWPCEEICDAIEEANSDDLDRGFHVGIRNSRGATMRSPLDGGDLERGEAANYRRWAAICDVDWPRTAASLRSVAESYKYDADREDAQAAERAQDRH
jgi:transcriptional regulator with XRE-family HTH domain